MIFKNVFCFNVYFPFVISCFAICMFSLSFFLDPLVICLFLLKKKKLEFCYLKKTPKSTLSLFFTSLLSAFIFILSFLVPSLNSFCCFYFSTWGVIHLFSFFHFYWFMSLVEFSLMVSLFLSRSPCISCSFCFIKIIAVLFGAYVCVIFFFVWIEDFLYLWKLVTLLECLGVDHSGLIFPSAQEVLSMYRFGSFLLLKSFLWLWF